jgi:O-antigen ligase
MVHHADTTELKGMNDRGSAEQRFEIWRTAVTIIGDYPVFGVGWGAYPQANAAYAPLGAGSDIELGARDTHSTYLNVLAESGVPGLALFLGMVSITLYGAEKVRRKCRHEMPKAARQLYFVEVALVSFLTAGVFGSYSKLSFLYVYLALIYAMTEVCRDDQRALRQVARTGGVPAARTG